MELTYFEEEKRHRARFWGVTGKALVVATSAIGCGYYEPEFTPLPGCKCSYTGIYIAARFPVFYYGPRFVLPRWRRRLFPEEG